MVLKLDKKNYMMVLPAIASRIDVELERLVEE